MPAGILRPVSGIRMAGLGMAEGTGSRLEDLAAAPCSQEEHWELLAEDCGAGLTGIGGLATVRAPDPVFRRGGRVGCARGERPGFLDAENRLQVGDSFFILEGFFPAVTRPALADPFLSLLRNSGWLEVGCSKNSQWAANLEQGCSPAGGWASLWGWAFQVLHQLCPDLSGHTPIAEVPGSRLHQGSPPASLG